MRPTYATYRCRNLYTRLYQVPCPRKNGFSNFASISAFPKISRAFEFPLGFRFSASSRFSLTACDTQTRVSDSSRNYQVVVAATRDMGIGKDGRLPWKLPSDLKFFKQITVTTSDTEKMNAVLMGRKTWESIPLKYRPLPARLNVVLTRTSSFDVGTAKNVVVCGSIPSALRLMAEPPYSLSIEKVFLIGGGQILREALNGPGCEAIHITEIETSIECDTFIPAIDLSLFKLYYLSSPMVENNVRYSFATYVRMKSSVKGTPDSSNEVEFNGGASTNQFDAEKFDFLQQMILERNDEFNGNFER